MATNSAQGSDTGAASATVQEAPAPTDASGATTDTATTSAKNGFFDGWPNRAKPVFALAVAAIWIGVPIVAAWSLSARAVQAGGVVDYQPLVAVLIALTTATITGIFVFMTFRIDRGTKTKAGEVARKTAKDVAEEAANKRLDKAVDEAKKAVMDAVSKCEVEKAIKEKLDTVASPDKIEQKVAERIKGEKLREHVKSVLTIDANVKAITAVAQEQAKSFDPDTILRISKLLKKAADAWARCAEGKERRKWWFFGG